MVLFYPEMFFAIPSGIKRMEGREVYHIESPWLSPLPTMSAVVCGYSALGSLAVAAESWTVLGGIREVQ